MSRFGISISRTLKSWDKITNRYETIVDMRMKKIEQQVVEDFIISLNILFLVYYMEKHRT